MVAPAISDSKTVVMGEAKVEAAREGISALIGDRAVAVDVMKASSTFGDRMEGVNAYRSFVVQFWSYRRQLGRESALQPSDGWLPVSLPDNS
jgi:hypothetical protein